MKESEKSDGIRIGVHMALRWIEEENAKLDQKKKEPDPKKDPDLYPE